MLVSDQIALLRAMGLDESEAALAKRLKENSYNIERVVTSYFEGVAAADSWAAAPSSAKASRMPAKKAVAAAPAAAAPAAAASSSSSAVVVLDDDDDDDDDGHKVAPKKPSSPPPLPPPPPQEEEAFYFIGRRVVQGTSLCRGYLFHWQSVALSLEGVEGKKQKQQAEISKKKAKTAGGKVRQRHFSCAPP